MRLIGVLGVLCFAVPAMAAPVTYVFDITSGSLDLESTIGNVSATVDGTFSADTDCHIDVSDTITLGDARIANTSPLVLTIPPVATITIAIDEARFLDFAQPVPAHIGPGGVAAIQTDAYVEVTAVVTGALNTTFSTGTWAGELLDFTLTITTSAAESETIIATLNGAFGYEIGVAEITQTITLDLIVSIEGTAHACPDPALGGLTALGLGGAGAWLRRRRS